MICLHHNDNDGRCAAAIVKNELNNIWEGIPTHDNFYEYSHTTFPTISDEDIEQTLSVYIVDIALNKDVFEFIKRCVEKNKKVYHIDHHKSGIDFYETLSDEDKVVYDKVLRFHNNTYSATMLCWVYACMSDDERKHPEDIPFDFTPDFSQVGFYVNDESKFRQIAIPNVVRFVDDNDVWRHSLPEAIDFAAGFRLEDDKSPCAEIWQKLLYENGGREIVRFINAGEVINKYQQSINRIVLNNAFESEIDGIKCLCLNTPHGNALIFCEKYDEYPLVVKFSYDGSIGKWRYTFYSNDKYADIVDCAKIASEGFNGGGHRGAASGWLECNIFAKQTDM